MTQPCVVGGALDDLRPHSLGPGVQGVGVLARLGRRAGQRLDDPGTERRLEHRQDLVAHPDAGEPRVGRCAGRSMVRAVGQRPRPRGGRDHHVTRQVEQRPAVDPGSCGASRPATGCPSRGRVRAARSRPGRRACGRRRTAAAPTGAHAARRRPGAAYRAARAAASDAARQPDPPGDVDSDHPGVQRTPGSAPARRPAPQPPPSRLEPVVDHHRLAQQPEVGAHRDGGSRQREGVGSAAERHDHRARRARGPPGTPGPRAHCGPRGPPIGHQPSTRRTHAAGSSISTGRGQVRRGRPRSGRSPGRRPWRSPPARSPRRWCTGASWCPGPACGARSPSTVPACERRAAKRSRIWATVGTWSGPTSSIT